MSYLHHITHSGRQFAPNQEKHYLETLSDTTESSASFGTAPDRPPIYEETTQFQQSQEHISQNLREEITQEISKLLEKISNLDKTIENYQLHREATEVDVKTQQWNQNVEHVEEPSGSTCNKEAFETSLLQVEQDNPSVKIEETPVDLWTLVFVLMEILVAAVESFGGRCGEDLLDGKIRIEDFSLINVCLIEDIFYSSDNRRLYCFKEAIKQGLDVDKISVRIRWEVVVSPSLRNGRVIDGEGYWEANECEEREKQRQYDKEERQKEREEQEKREVREREKREKQRQYEQEERQKDREEKQKRKNNMYCFIISCIVYIIRIL
ncbi:21908_t:CDS:2 [Dentiscutata erythropus]|uniref:21908_t:CDS:1 n=1 Tax=Dentiscutata erythropus TaxID=1348616 RepID=A0A9N8YZC4_9GLOM|nr:21908_t:CDS:2 [Dentiscutata erythropus]